MKEQEKQTLSPRSNRTFPQELRMLGKICKAFLPHLLIALSLTLLVLLVTDQYNRAMNFINNDLTKGGLFVFVLLVIVQSVLQIIRNRKRK